MYNEQWTQGNVPLDFITPTNAAAASYNSAAFIDMSKVKRATYVIYTGLFTASGTVDARIQSSPNSNFNVVHNVAGTNITQLTASNTNAETEVRAEYIQQQNYGDRYIRLNVTVGTAAVNFGAIGFGAESEQKPASQYVNTTLVPSIVAN